MRLMIGENRKPRFIDSEFHARSVRDRSRASVAGAFFNCAMGGRVFLLWKNDGNKPRSESQIAPLRWGGALLSTRRVARQYFFLAIQFRDDRQLRNQPRKPVLSRPSAISLIGIQRLTMKPKYPGGLRLSEFCFRSRQDQFLSGRHEIISHCSAFAG